MLHNSFDYVIAYIITKLSRPFCKFTLLVYNVLTPSLVTYFEYSAATKQSPKAKKFIQTYRRNIKFDNSKCSVIFNIQGYPFCGFKSKRK